jgi:regulator of protease activity HflC (stomatin/prohibitin superfamily)
MAAESTRTGFVQRFLARHEESESRPAVIRHRGDFRFNTISALAVVFAMGLGLGMQMYAASAPANEDVAIVAAGVLAAAGILFVVPYWATVVVAIAAVWATLPVLFDTDLSVAAAFISAGLLIAPGIEIISQWDKIVVLRLGRFHKVRGPGPLLLLPLLDTIAGYVDTRIRVTDFSAEKSLTRDTVPVHIDALAFWMIWDAHRAVLEVQEFDKAVILSAQTALRASIGANDLSTLLGERERLGREIQQIVDAKTNPWGITILSVEFKEIIVPRELEDALSREAQASRERKARLILGKTEADVAASYSSAAGAYRDDPVALQLRAMNMIYESIRNKGGLVLLPSDALRTMNLGTVLGARAYHEQATEAPSGGADARGDAEVPGGAEVPGADTERTEPRGPDPGPRG